MTRALVSLGSNLGDRLGQLQAATAAYADVLVGVSPVYETPPWGDPDQPSYYNAVLLVAADVTPEQWLDRAAAAEQAAGRERDPDRPFGPRSLDVDVVAVWRPDGSAVYRDDPALTLPHPRAHLRAFVLRPWLDLDPDAELPGRGPVAGLLQTVTADAADLVRLDGVALR